MDIYAKKVRTSIRNDGTASIAFDCSWKAKSIIEQLKFDDYVISIKQATNKRTLAQNRYLWELIGQIAMKENGNTADDIDIYCQLLEETGIKCVYFLGLPDIEEDLKNKSGFRVVKVVDDREYNGKLMYMYKCYFGSSKMNTKEMAALLDKTIERAEACGIDTDVWKMLLLGEEK